jgi:4-amino-4-deoxy-L-arabinose transferase-like glycosyltransferase
MPPTFRARLGLIAGAGFVLRAVWALAIAPQRLTHTGDSRYFHLTANLLADGHGYIQPLPYVWGGATIPSSEHPPGWSAVLALFSVAGGSSYTVHELVGCAVGAGIVVCVGLLARRVGGDRAGLIAAAIAAIYPVYVAMDGSLMSEPPYALGVALCLLAAFHVVQSPSARRFALLGLAIGLTALIRGEALVFLVVLAVPVVLATRRRRVAYLALVWLVALVAIAPWSVRNSTTFDKPMLLSSEDGPVIAGANCAATYHGSDTGYWRSDCLAHGHDRNAVFRSDRLRGDGVRYAREHAGRLPTVEAVRLLRTFGLWQPVRHVYFAEGRTMPLREIAVVCVWLVLAFGAIGAWALRRRRTALAILLAPVVVAVITTLVAFGYARFRYAADVSLIVLAGVAVDQLLARRRLRRAARAAPARA